MSGPRRSKESVGVDVCVYVCVRVCGGGGGRGGLPLLASCFLLPPPMQDGVSVRHSLCPYFFSKIAEFK